MHSVQHNATAPLFMEITPQQNFNTQSRRMVFLYRRDKTENANDTNTISPCMI